MKTIYIAITILGALFLAGCGGQETATTETPTETTATKPAVQVAYAPGSIKKGDQAHCVICVTKEGTDQTEEVHETLDYEGKTYAFCDADEKAEFISDPSKFVKK